MKRLTSLFLSLFLFAFAGSAQTVQVKGLVGDSTGAPLQGVSVIVRDSKKGTQTDSKGNFSITVTSSTGKISLVFSYTGFLSQTVTASNGASLNVVLQRDNNPIEDVVVIGYQTVRRKDLLASVSSVGAKELKDIPINSAAEALNGRLAGVTATTSEGSPDAEVRVRVRGGMSITGDNSPLYIVDGVQVENALNVISPQDIQNIDVLKDAAATAIYGARGANGVIVITTKSGKPGKLRVTYNGFVGVKTLASKLDVLSPYEYIVYNYERSRASTAEMSTFASNFGTTWDTLKNYRNVPAVDWQEKVAGRTGITTTHNVGFSGGTNKTTYNFAYTYNNDKAIVLNSNYIRNLLNFKADHKITKSIKLGVGARYTLQDVYGAGISDDKGSSYNRLRNAVKYRPFLSANQDIDDADPLADANVGNGLSLTNPIQLANAEYRKKSTRAYNINANLTYNITKRLSFKSTVGFDRNNVIDKQYSDSITPYSVIQGGRKPIATLDTTAKKVLTNSNVLTYKLNNYKNRHDLTAFIGEETYQLETETHGRTIRDIPTFTAANTAFKNTSLGNLMGLPRLYKSKYTSLSFFGHVDYAFLDRYMVSFNLRADGASKFAPDQRWGYFPSASVAWKAKNEKFMSGVDFISDLKFRLSYGAMGNNRIDDYLYLTTFRNDQYYYSINGQLVPAYNSTSLVNENLKWESLINKNIGLDVAFLKNRISLTFDYYINNSKDLLLSVPVASTYGYSTQLQNIGETSNKGWEVQINANIIQHKKNNFTWTANFNISSNRNKVEALGLNQKSFFPAASWGVSGQPTDYIVRIGDPVGAMWGLVTDGWYKVSDFDYNPTTQVYTLKAGVVRTNAAGSLGMPEQPGTIKFKDLNNDGVIDLNNDRTIIGDPTPDFTGGLNQQFTYKQWDMSVFMNFTIGGDIYNANKIEFTNAYTANSNLLAIMQNRWRNVDANGIVVTDPTALTALNANAQIWSPIRGSGAFYPHSWAIEDGSFLRINNVSIGYTFPIKTMAKLKMSRLRLYATANNLAVITGYSGYDPEVSVKRSPLTPNLDYSAYPKSRTYIFGVNVTF
jgi:TonB-linked SusC/RagA family outer membrane protein